jgi:hypothetical protein
MPGRSANSGFATRSTRAVDHHLRGRERGEPDLDDLSVEDPVAMGGDGEVRLLSGLDAAHVGFVDFDLDLHLHEAARDPEQRGGLERRDHGHPRLDVALEHHPIDRGDDSGLLEVGPRARRRSRGPWRSCASARARDATATCQDVRACSWTTSEMAPLDASRSSRSNSRRAALTFTRACCRVASAASTAAWVWRAWASSIWSSSSART